MQTETIELPRETSLDLPLEPILPQWGKFAARRTAPVAEKRCITMKSGLCHKGSLHPSPSVARLVFWLLSRQRG